MTSSVAAGDGTTLALGYLHRTVWDVSGTVTTFANPADAFANAMSRAGENDRIVVFGSFYTVAGVMAARKHSQH